MKKRNADQQRTADGAEGLKSAGRAVGFRLFEMLGALLFIGLFVCLSQGCGKSEIPTADAEPFKAAIAEYLEQKNMAMALKTIKAGPTIEGKTATLTASLQHATIPGPAVTWKFRFEQSADGTWKAVGHE